MKRLLIIVGLVILLVLSVSAGQTCYSPIMVNNGQVPTTQTDFPILIYQVDQRLKTLAHGGHVSHSTGYDIRPYSDSSLTTSLTYELERYNGSTGEVIMWVKRSSLSDGNITYLGYGDSTLNVDGSDGPNTFSNNFLSVSHLKNGATLDVSDSTGINTFTNNGAEASSGQIDGSGVFDSGSSQYISASVSFPSPGFTMSAWVRAFSFPNSDNVPVACGSDYKVLNVRSSGKLRCEVSATNDVSYSETGTHQLQRGIWYYLTMTYDSVNGLIGYVNAEQDDTVAADGNSHSSASLDIGQAPTFGGRFWNGDVDEVHVATVARSADWITTEFNNQNSPGSFESLGDEVCFNATPTPSPTCTPGSFTVSCGSPF